MGNIMAEMLCNETSRNVGGVVTTAIEQKVSAALSPATRDREKWLGVGPKNHELAKPHHHHPSD